MAATTEVPAVPSTDQDWMYLELELRYLFSAGPIDEEQLFAGRQNQIKQLFEATLERSPLSQPLMNAVP